MSSVESSRAVVWSVTNTVARVLLVLGGLSVLTAFVAWAAGLSWVLIPVLVSCFACVAGAVSRRLATGRPVVAQFYYGFFLLAVSSACLVVLPHEWTAKTASGGILSVVLGVSAVVFLSGRGPTTLSPGSSAGSHGSGDGGAC